MRVIFSDPKGDLSRIPAAFVAAVTSAAFGGAIAFILLRYVAFGYEAVDLLLVLNAAMASVLLCLCTVSYAVVRVAVPFGIAFVFAVFALLFTPRGFALATQILFLLAAVFVLRRADALGGRSWLAVFSGLVVGVCLALRHAARLIDSGYAHALVPEAVRAGVQHKDTVFHAAIAALFNQSGTVSIGLDGPVPVGYHALSHMFIGGLGSALGLASPEAYALVVPVFLGPLMMAALLAAVKEVAPETSRSIPATIVLACGLWVMIVGNYFFKSYWVSESYLFSLSLMLALIAYAAGLARGGAPVGVRGVLVIAGFVAAVSLAKISTGAVSACGMAVWLWLARGRPTVRGAVEGAVFALVPFLAVYFLFFTAAAGTGPTLQPFAYLMSAPKRLWPPILLLVWLTVVIVRRKRIDAVAAGLLSMGWSAVAASALLNPVAGAAGYFAGPGHWATFVLAIRLWHPVRTRTEGRGLAILAAVLLLVGVQNFARRTTTLVRDMATAIDATGLRIDAPFSGP